MAGLLDESLEQAGLNEQGLSAAAQMSATHQIQDMRRKAGVRAGIGELIGLPFGQAIHSASNQGWSQMLGTIGKRLQGGLLNNTAPAMNVSTPSAPAATSAPGGSQ